MMTRFPAYQRFLAMPPPIPVLVVIGSEDPLRPPWRNIGRVMAQIPEQVTIGLFQGAAHAINFKGIPVLRLQRPA